MDVSCSNRVMMPVRERLLSVAAAAFLLVPVSSTTLRQGSSSKPAGSWDSDAIGVTFDAVRIDDGKHLLFYYVLKNLTDQDYRIADGSNIVVMAKRRGRRNALAKLSAKDIKVFYPITLPPKQRHILLMRDLRRTYNFKSELTEVENPTPEQEQAEQKRLQALINRISPSFNGFVIFDKATSREIDLPKGW